MAKKKTKKAPKKTPAKERKIKDRFDLDLDMDKIKKICRIVEAGNFRYVACQRLGISLNTFSNWIQNGKKDLREFEAGRRDYITTRVLLIEELEKAEGKCHSRLLHDIVSSDNLTAKMWFLERRWNKLYNKNPNAKIDDETGETIKIDATAILADRLSQLLEGSKE